MKIYSKKDFIFGIIMALALPGRIVEGLRQWGEGEAGGLLWIGVVLALAGKYFYDACNEEYNVTNTEAKELRQRAGRRRFGRMCTAMEVSGPVMGALSTVFEVAVPEIGHSLGMILLLLAVIVIIWFERSIYKMTRTIRLEEMNAE